MVNTRVLTGLMELIPEQQIAFDKMKRIIEDEYVAFGYTPIDTPVIDFIVFYFRQNLNGSISIDAMRSFALIVLLQ